MKRLAANGWQPGPAGAPIDLRALEDGLRKHWPVPVCELKHRNAYELMVGVILSAQSTDKTVNEISPAIFARYPTPAAMAKARALDLEKMVFRTGFFRAKTKSLLGACRMIVQQFGGEVPKTMEELVELPGIGRKSANVILGVIHGIASGIVVDTHMIRLANRFKLTTSDDAVKVEQDLCRVIPEKKWIWFSHAMVRHGRYICVARRPRCWGCELFEACPAADKTLGGPTGPEVIPATTILGQPIHTRGQARA